MAPHRKPNAVARSCCWPDYGVEGCTEAALLANGVTTETMVDLVRIGLATATPQRVKAGRDLMEVAVVPITEAGRRALTEP